MLPAHDATVTVADELDTVTRLCTRIYHPLLCNNPDACTKYDKRTGHVLARISVTRRVHATYCTNIAARMITTARITTPAIPKYIVNSCATSPIVVSATSPIVVSATKPKQEISTPKWWLETRWTMCTPSRANNHNSSVGQNTGENIFTHS